MSKKLNSKPPSLGCWTLWAHSGFTLTRVLDALGPLGIHSGATPQNHLSRVPPHSKPPCNKYYLLTATPLEATPLETTLQQVLLARNHPTRIHHHSKSPLSNNTPLRIPPHSKPPHSKSPHSKPPHSSTTPLRVSPTGVLSTLFKANPHQVQHTSSMDMLGFTLVYINIQISRPCLDTFYALGIRTPNLTRPT